MAGTRVGGPRPSFVQERPQDHQKDREEQHAENLKRYRFLVDRLRADIRFLLHSLPEFVELPGEGSAGAGQPGDRAWTEVFTEAERQVVSLASEQDMSLEALAGLLNHRDRAVCLLCEGVLFQAALLRLDLRPQGVTTSADEEEGDKDGPLAEFLERLQPRAGKDTRLPEKYELRELPIASEPGPFTYDRSKAVANTGGMVGSPGSQAAGEPAAPSKLEGRLLGALREMQCLDGSIRRVKFGERVRIPGKGSRQGRLMPAAQVRREITSWCDRCAQLEHELQTRKAQRHTPWEVQLEFYKARSQEKDQQHLSLKSRVFKLEQEVNNFKQDFATLRREKSELAERNQKLASESLPVLDRIDGQLEKARERVDQLTADAEMLSSMFKLQVEESQRTAGEQDRVNRELGRVRKLLKEERDDGKYKEDELQKKEKLHRLTLEAREAAHKDYLTAKEQVLEAQRRLEDQREAWQAQLREAEGREEERRRLAEELARAHREIDELEQLKKHVMREYSAVTGTPYGMLLEQFKQAAP